jgi:hypothetical protein
LETLVNAVSKRAPPSRMPSAAEPIAGRSVVVDGEVCGYHLGLPVEDPDARPSRNTLGAIVKT